MTVKQGERNSNGTDSHKSIDTNLSRNKSHAENKINIIHDR